jgi:squalene synthase HpnC
VHELALPRECFARLIEANRRDLTVDRYDTFEELLGYCRLSAAPVGELVLHVFGAATPDRIALSDRVCAGLQLTEHLQDVAEDYARGRIYVPREDLERFGCEEQALGARAASEPLRAAIAFEVSRAHGLLDMGARLVRLLPPRAAIAVAGFAGGGRAALRAIERAGCDVLTGPPRASRTAQAASILRTLAVGR